MTKLVVVIQCEHALKRCCGFWCTRDFYDRLGPFADYPSDTQYMTFSCGGCCGQGLAAKVEIWPRGSSLWDGTRRMWSSISRRASARTIIITRPARSRIS